MFRFLTITLFFLFSVPAAVLAYGDGAGSGGDAGTSLSNSTTKKLTRTLTRGAKACQRLNKPYRYDCYRQVYRLAAQQLNGRPPYADAQKVLIEVEKSLERTITQNADNTAPRVRRGVQTFRAIKPAAIPGAKQDFIAALEKAETKLLRTPEKGTTHYARIAEAINSNKVLLRSAMLLMPVLMALL